MSYGVKILLDSVAPNGRRLITGEFTYPRFVHAELMTHRLFSRNSASSRAIPTAKLMERIRTDPAMPVWWGKNQAGMQAREELSPGEIEIARALWLQARDNALVSVERLSAFGLHKQIANRLLEPWMFITVIVTATEWDNWDHLRCHPDAQPEIKWVADAWKVARAESTPTLLDLRQWHMPLLFDDERLHLEELRKAFAPSYLDQLKRFAKISVARCARVSYLTHDGRKDYDEDVALHDRLANSGHWSPFEHVAAPHVSANAWVGNFRGWIQYRKTMEGEAGPSGCSPGMNG